MNKTTVFVVIVIIGLIGNLLLKKHHSPRMPDSAATHEIPTSAPPNDVTEKSERFKCDGRIYCSQMTSCEEAKFFLQNCPGVKMDGNGDGVPCEKQWCK